MIDVPDHGSLLTEGICLLVAGISGVITSVLGFFLLRTIRELDAKADASALRSLQRKHEELRDRYDALLIRTLGVEKDLAVMAATNAGRDERLDDVRAISSSIDKKVDAILMRTPPRGMLRPSTT